MMCIGPMVWHGHPLHQSCRCSELSLNGGFDSIFIFPCKVLLNNLIKNVVCILRMERLEVPPLFPKKRLKGRCNLKVPPCR
jgi:hypothetical protein